MQQRWLVMSAWIVGMLILLLFVLGGALSLVEFVAVVLGVHMAYVIYTVWRGHKKVVG